MGCRGLCIGFQHFNSIGKNILKLNYLCCILTHIIDLLTLIEANRDDNITRDSNFQEFWETDLLISMSCVCFKINE